MNRIFLSILTAAAGVLSSYSSDPQMFIYRNDNGFNATHLSAGVTVTHSVSDNPTMRLLDEDGQETLIPVSAIDSCVIRLTDIPTLRFTLPGYPEADGVWSKTDYVDAILDIEGNGYCEDAEDLTLSLRGRGNSTWGMAKKPMRMKFAKKVSLFGLAKQKNYVLLANYIDDSLMKNAIGLWLARRLGVPYANHTVPVNVVINGRHRGSYLLTEKVGINAGSVDIDEESGILFELSVEYDEPYKFRSELWNLPVMVKDPDFGELAEDNPEGPAPDERLGLWQADFNYATRLANGAKGSEAFDLNSFARGILLYQICLNSEIGFPKSFYIHKERMGKESLYKFGPAWDFDVTFDFPQLKEDGNYEARKPQNGLWLNPLLEAITNDPRYLPLYRTLLEKFADEDLPELLKFIREYAAEIEPSAKMDAVVWPETYSANWYLRRPASDVRQRAEQLCQWITDRIDYLLEEADKRLFNNKCEAGVDGFLR